MKKLLIIPLSLFLSGCLGNGMDLRAPDQPENWSVKQSALSQNIDAKDLHQWWNKFNDPALSNLVTLSLAHSPDRLMAEARILEARGLRRTSRSFLFPQIGASGSTGRENTEISGTSADSFYDAQFDASFEIDIFGQNRKTASAADATVKAAEAQYNDATLTLIAEVTRSYIDYRAAQNQVRIANKNLKSQERTLDLIRDLNRLGSAPRLDVERAINLVSTTRASVHGFEQQKENARLRLSVLTGALPAIVQSHLVSDAEIPGAEVEPVLMAPAQVLALRPDILAASATLAANTSLSEAATAELFPSFTISGFYGIADSALLNAANPWNVGLGAAVSLLDFGRIEGRIDAARAREKIAYEQYRKTILAAVQDVESAISDYAHIEEQTVSLLRAYKSAEKALELSEVLFKEGEVSFLDVLDVQRNANAAESAVIEAKAAKAESLTRMFKSLGVY